MPPTPPKPLYVLHGTDDFLRRRHRRRIIDEVVGNADPELTVTRFDAGAELSDVLDELRTRPFLAERRLVIVEGADDFVTRHRGALEKYAASPAQTGCLMLVVNQWRRSRLSALAAKVGEVADCSSPTEGSLPQWISAAADERGKTIARDAADLLGQWVGTDLGLLDSEIEKLSLYLGPRKRISARDVAAVVAGGAGPTPFGLVNAIDSRQLGRALTELDAMLAAPGQEIRILGLLAWKLRSRLGGGGGGGRRGRGQETPPAPREFRSVLAADLAIKTGADALTMMQLLVARLCLGVNY